MRKKKQTVRKVLGMILMVGSAAAMFTVALVKNGFLETLTAMIISALFVSAFLIGADLFSENRHDE